MVRGTENVFFTQFDGQELPLDLAIFARRRAAEAGMVENRRVESEKGWHETCSLIRGSNGLNQPRAGGN
jgi:hypothetical protein